MYLLDTNIFSALRKLTTHTAPVHEWAKTIQPDDIFLSVLVIGEIHKGIAAVRRNDPRAAVSLSTWLGRTVDEHRDRILRVDQRAAELWGPLNVPDPLPVIDSLLAATALVHDLTLVTRNVRDVARTGVKVLNPFEGT